MASFWTDDNTNEMIKMWGEGLSADAISYKFRGQVTRNAVIGKLHRMGYSDADRHAPNPINRADRHERNANKKPRKARTGARLGVTSKSGKVKENHNGVSRPKGEVYATRPSLVPKGPEIEHNWPSSTTNHEVNKSTAEEVLSLGSSQCRWPIGEPQKEDFHFCRNKRKKNSSYCTEHDSMATRSLRKWAKRTYHHKQSTIGGRWK